MGKPMVKVIVKQTGELLGKLADQVAKVLEDIIIVAGLAFIVRASFMISPLAGYYTLGSLLLLLGLAMSAGRKTGGDK